MSSFSLREREKTRFNLYFNLFRTSHVVQVSLRAINDSFQGFCTSYKNFMLSCCSLRGFSRVINDDDLTHSNFSVRYIYILITHSRMNRRSSTITKLPQLYSGLKGLSIASLITSRNVRVF